jgi:hypothetical protein
MLTSINELLIRQHIKARGELADDLKLDPIVEEAVPAFNRSANDGEINTD